MTTGRLPPQRDRGMRGWVRANLFATTGHTIATVLVAAVVLWAGLNLLTWVIGAANWERLWVNLKLFAVFRYPVDLLWRPLVAAGVILFAFGATSFGAEAGTARIVRGAFWQFWTLMAFLTVVAFVAGWQVAPAYLLATVMGMAGFAAGRWLPAASTHGGVIWLVSLLSVPILLYGIPGLSGAMRVVPIRMWGGFMLTLVLTTGIVPSFPIGVALALGRRSKLPAIKYVCIAFIELIRGAPLIVWLFVANLMVPLLFNIGPDAVPSLGKAYIALTLFSSAYMAENVRGGLQSVPIGQSEAARALGLSGWQTTMLIVLPQAIRAVIPAIVGQAIGLFKDTSLVFILNLQDFFNVHNIVAQQPASIQVTGGIRLELSLFLAVTYFFFAYRMSVASRQLERLMGVGER
ncbi:MAG: amino acid ABC transporter permease [Trueperaceae bacterium]